MGRSYLFECAKCGYQASVSGGADSGSEFCVQTATCRDCRALLDCVVRLRVPDAGLKIPSELQRLPPLSTKKFKWVSFKIRCPVSPAHRVHAWNEPGKCPRCGNYLDKNALPFRYWD